MRLLDRTPLLRSSILTTVALLAPASVLALAGCSEPSGDGGNEAPTTGIEGGDGDGDSNETGTSMSGDGDGDAGDGDGDAGDGDGDDSGGIKFDTLALGDAGNGDCGPGDVNDAVLTGTVYAPNGVIPVVGA